MSKYILILSFVLFAAFACTKAEQESDMGYIVFADVTLDSSVTEISPSAKSEITKMTINIYDENNSNILVKSIPCDVLPDKVGLNVGTYTVEIVGGNGGSINTLNYKGSVKGIEVKPKQSTAPIHITCSIDGLALRFKFDDTIKSLVAAGMITDIYIKATTKEGGSVKYTYQNSLDQADASFKTPQDLKVSYSVYVKNFDSEIYGESEITEVTVANGNRYNITIQMGQLNP